MISLIPEGLINTDTGTEFMSSVSVVGSLNTGGGVGIEIDGDGAGVEGVPLMLIIDGDGVAGKKLSFVCIV
jgi:hypothetical protein